MSEDVRLLLAMLATCPAIAAFIVGMTALDGHTIDDFRDGLLAWAGISIALLVVVSAGWGLVFVWTWAV